jgi:DNA sulfur modification protein DndD
MDGLPTAEIKQREATRKTTEKKVQDLRLTRNTLETENTADQRSIEKLRREVDALALKNEFARKLIRRRDLATLASTKLVEVLKHYESEARLEIQKSVNDILERVARKDYKLEIGEDFELRLLYSNGQPTPKSGGENQLMSLAFISSLVRFAKRRSEDKSTPFFVPATVAPLILDSPFGQLDDNYRIGTASFVPEMAPQVVLLVSSSQGKAEVIDAISSRIGAEYVLISQSRASRGERKQDVLVIDGKSMVTTLFDCERDLTRIERISK